jgi:hypothetical protein
MTAHDFHTWTRRQPFVPFRVVTSGGRILEVPAPHFILVCPDAVVIGEPHPDDSLAASRYDIVPMRDVARVEPCERLS